MNISMYGPSNEFTESLFSRLQTALPQDTLSRWSPDAPPPTPSPDVLLSLARVDAHDLDQCPNLGLVQTVSDGYDAVDINAATARGIWVSYSPGEETGNADSVAEFAILLLLAAARRLNLALNFVHDTTQPRPLLNQALVGKKVCIVGLGSIGTRIADRLRPFGVILSAIDRNPEKHTGDIPVSTLSDDKGALAGQDFVVLAVRGSKDNAHLVDRSFLGAMQPGSTLINVARGTLVDEVALTEALKSGHLLAAGLDVFEHEPPQRDNPLLSIPNAFLTPHMAGFTDLTRDGSVQFLTELLDQYRSGKRFASLLNQPEQPRHPLS